MKIVVDENINYAQELFGLVGEVITVPGRPLSKMDLAEADALVVRSVTKVDHTLLAGTPVRFVGSATSGVDHVDREWLQSQGIAFSFAPGCSAGAIVEYIMSALLMLAERDGFLLNEKRVGIVGVGHSGSLLEYRLRAMNVETLLCDPLRADKGDQGPFLLLDRLVREADILTFHTPLERNGPNPTWHLVDDDLLAVLPEGRMLVNTARGGVFDNTALLKALDKGKRLSLIIDVWENEPNLLLPLLAKAEIATPHIAGYSVEGKARGTAMVFYDFCEFLGKSVPFNLEAILPKPTIGVTTLYGRADEAIIKRLAHLVYDVRRDDAPMRRLAGWTGEFDCLRKFYPERREWSSLQVACADEETMDLLRRLGFGAPPL